MARTRIPRVDELTTFDPVTRQPLRNIVGSPGGAPGGLRSGVSPDVALNAVRATQPIVPRPSGTLNIPRIPGLTTGGPSDKAREMLARNVAAGKDSFRKPSERVGGTSKDRRIAEAHQRAIDLRQAGPKAAGEAALAVAKEQGGAKHEVAKDKIAGDAAERAAIEAGLTLRKGTAAENRQDAQDMLASAQNHGVTMENLKATNIKVQAGLEAKIPGTKEYNIQLADNIAAAKQEALDARDLEGFKGALVREDMLTLENSRRQVVEFEARMKSDLAGRTISIEERDRNNDVVGRKTQTSEAAKDASPVAGLDPIASPDLNGDGDVSKDEQEYNSIANLLKSQKDSPLMTPAKDKRLRTRLAELEEQIPGLKRKPSGT